MWNKMVVESLKVASVLFSDLEEDEKKKRLLEMAMDLWDMVDPTPSFDLDDQIVEVIMAHVVDWIVETTEDLVKN